MTIELSALAIGLLSRPLRGSPPTNPLAGEASSFEALLQSLQGTGAAVPDVAGPAEEPPGAVGGSSEQEDDEDVMEFQDTSAQEAPTFELHSSEQPVELVLAPEQELAGPATASSQVAPNVETSVPASEVVGLSTEGSAFLAGSPVRGEVSSAVGQSTSEILQTKPGVAKAAVRADGARSGETSSAFATGDRPELRDPRRGTPQPDVSRAAGPAAERSALEISAQTSRDGAPASMLVLSPAFVATMPKQSAMRASQRQHPSTMPAAPAPVLVGRVTGEILEPAYRAPLEQAMAPARPEVSTTRPEKEGALAADRPASEPLRAEPGETRRDAPADRGERSAAVNGAPRAHDPRIERREPEPQGGPTPPEVPAIGATVDPQKARALVDIPIVAPEPSTAHVVDSTERNDEISALVDRMAIRRAVHATLVDPELGRVGVHVEASPVGLDLRVEAALPGTLKLLSQSRTELEAHLKTEAVPVAHVSVVQAPAVAVRPVSDPIAPVLDPRRVASSSSDHEEPPMKEDRPRRGKPTVTRRVRVVM
jgi:hypothetical protein